MAGAKNISGALSHILNSPTPFLADGGLEETLRSKHGFDLPHSASFPLLDSNEGRAALRDYYINHIKFALEHQTGIILRTPTWRAGTTWFERVGQPAARLPAINRSAVHMLVELKHGFENPQTPIVISGCIGPLHDTYLSADETTTFFASENYYMQVHALAEAGVDMLSLTLAVDINEVKAVVRLAREHKLPITVSFSLEADGRLLGGRTLAGAIAAVDKATNGYVAYYGIECAHPSMFRDVLCDMDRETLARIGSVRADRRAKSKKPELTRNDSLGPRDAEMSANGYADIRAFLPRLYVVGGYDDETYERCVTAIAGKGNCS